MSIKVLLAVGLVCLLPSGAFAVTKAHKTTSSKARKPSQHSKTVSHSKTSHSATGHSLRSSAKTSKTSHGKKNAKSTRGRRGRLSARRRPTRPSYQTHPTPERYKEIQQALADRGYYKGDVNGEWGPDATDALKRFQTDKKLPNDGKINSLSLIGLGLGPEHAAYPKPAAPASNTPSNAPDAAPPSAGSRSASGSPAAANSPL